MIALICLLFGLQPSNLDSDKFAIRQAEKDKIVRAIPYSYPLLKSLQASNDMDKREFAKKALDKNYVICSFWTFMFSKEMLDYFKADSTYAYYGASDPPPEWNFNQVDFERLIIFFEVLGFYDSKKIESEGLFNSPSYLLYSIKGIIASKDESDKAKIKKIFPFLPFKP